MKANAISDSVQMEVYIMVAKIVFLLNFWVELFGE